jgi:hypothetical protein
MASLFPDLGLSARAPGTTSTGAPFQEAKIQLVWEKASLAPNANPAIYRLDSAGALIRRADYGLTVRTGWEIDHMVPVATGGGDDLDNLQPLQWQNNRSKGDEYPYWIPAVALVQQFITK